MEKSLLALDGKKHAIPRKFLGFMADIECGLCVESIGVGYTGIRKNPSGFKCKIKYFCESTRVFKIELQQGVSRTDFYVKALPGQESSVHELISRYNPKKYN